jgi:hypothetical protein
MICKCGCGEPTRKYRVYVHGHNRRYVKLGSDYAIQDMGYSTPCWLWLKTIGENGYGRARVLPRRWTVAHSKYYADKYGPVPAGLELDHLCRVRRCVNPDHLEPVTRSENVRRGAGFGGVLRVKP